jgi:hypothetical protein
MRYYNLEEQKVGENMGKAKLLGRNKSYIPNAKADLRFHKKICKRGREIAERDPYEIHERREQKRMEALKYGRSEV